MPSKNQRTEEAGAEGKFLSVDLGVSDAALGATLRGILENLGDGEVAAVGPMVATGGHGRRGGRANVASFGSVDVAEVERQLEEQLEPRVRAREGKTVHVVKRGRARSIRGKNRKLRIATFVDLLTASSTAEQTASEIAALDLALAQAEERGTGSAAMILSSNEMVPSSEMANLIGISRQAVDKRRLAGQLLALKGGARTLKYPRWQILPTGEVISGLKEVLQRVAGDTWTAYRLLREKAPDGSERRLYELLRVGEVQPVLTHVDGVLGGSTT